MEEQKNNNKPIGIFDSGVGGLTVAREVRRILPAEDIVYFADKEFFPYGEKSRSVIAERALKICMYLAREKNCKAIVIACNTATAAGLKLVREKFSEKNIDVPVIGVIHAGSLEAVRATKNGRIGVLATRSTVKSKAYSQEIYHCADGDDDVEVVETAAPLLVDYVEHELFDSVEDLLRVARADDEDLNEYAASVIDAKVQNSEILDPSKFSAKSIVMASEAIKPLTSENVDTIVLGCTHFPLATALLKTVLPSGITLVSPSACTAEELRDILKERNLFCEQNSSASADAADSLGKFTIESAL